MRTDTIRGLACLMLVAYHVVGANKIGGMKVGDSSIYRTVIAEGPLLVRMPLFTFLSGYVYAYRPVRAGRVRVFVNGKVRRLLIPMVVAGTLFALLQVITPSANTPIELDEVWKIYIWPFAHYWYLHALFIIFMAMVVLDRFNLIDRVNRFALAMAAAIGLFFLAPHGPKIFGLEYAMYLVPFFLWGVGVHRFGQWFTAGRGRTIAISIGAVALAANIAVLALDIDIPHSRFTVFGLVVGLAVTLGVQMLGAANSWLAKLGTYSYAIYLYHVFATAGTRIVVKKVVDANAIIFTTSLIAGLVFPIVVSELAKRHPWSKLLFLGQSTKPKPVAAPAAATSAVADQPITS